MKNVPLDAPGGVRTEDHEAPSSKGNTLQLVPYSDDGSNSSSAIKAFDDGGGGGGGGSDDKTKPSKGEKRSLSVLLTTAAMFLMFVIERGDDSVLPSSYAYVGQALAVGPTALSTVNLARALTQAAVAPLSGVLGDRCDRVAVVVAGAVLWGLATLAMAAMKSVGQAVGLAVFNGIGLSLIIPSVQSLIADMYAPSQRGRAFGALYMISSLGSMAFGFFATSVGGTQVGKLAGWRFAFAAVGGVSLAAALLVALIARDDRTKARKDAVEARKARRIAAGLPPTAKEDDTENDGNGVAALARAFARRGKDMASDVGKVLRVPTFIIIVVQGIVGSMPWTALSFLTLYLQMRGFEPVPAATVVALWGLGCAVGSALGGIVGDFASKRFPVAGRIMTCQFSVAVSIPAAFLMTWWLPVGKDLARIAASHTSASTVSLAAEQGHAVGVAAAIFFALGSLVAWCGTNNSAMFSEVVPERLRSSVFAFDRSFETAIGALAGPIVGALSPKFGFKGTIKPHAAGVDQAALDANARALGNAMLCMMVVPWALCGLAYFGLYFTLAKDRATAARMEEELEREDEAAKRAADAKHEAEVAEAEASRSASLASSLSLSLASANSSSPASVGQQRRSEDAAEDVPLK